MKAESWQRLSRAMKFYESQGFKYRDVPWTVEPAYSALTKPESCEDFYIKNKVLVGSAEQSFLSKYLTLDDHELYYAITPCFRDEKNIDELHGQYFMKLELFTKSIRKLDYIRLCAHIFFNQEIPLSIKKSNQFPVKVVVLGKDDYDLTYKGIELGSYNTKQNGDMVWACGTGLAEPRFSTALTK